MIVYAAKRNSDQTEGRGHMYTFALFANLDDAVQAVQREGVMGVGTGDVYEETIFESLDEWKNAPKRGYGEGRVYGHKQNPYGEWEYGFTDNREYEHVVQSTEYQEYVRLKKKFGGS